MVTNVMTSDDMFHRAKNADDSILELLGKEDFNSDDKAEIERLELVSKDYYERSQLARELQSKKDQLETEFASRPNPQPSNTEDDKSKKDDGLDGFKNIGSWLQSVYQFESRKTVDDRLRIWSGSDNSKPFSVSDKKALAENVGASGGFLVQPEFERRIRSAQSTMAIIRPRATIIRMAARTMTISVLDQTNSTAGEFSWFGGIVTSWLEEAGSMAETQPAFKQSTLTAHNLTAYTISSTQLLDDSGQALEDFLMGNLGFPGAIAATEDYAFLQGDGLGKPEGIINSAARFLVNRQTANTVTYDDLAAMLTHMMPTGNGIWVAHQSVLEKLLLMEGPSGNPSYLWGSASTGVPASLLGRPIIFTDKLPFVGTEGDIAFIDPSFYLIGDRQQTTIALSTDEHFRTNQVSWRAMHRVDGKPWLSAPITYVDGTFQVSPFVVLSDVAT